MTPCTSTKASTSAPTFAGLGVRTLINCRGTYTILSGSRALPQVAQAMWSATNHYVHMDELMDKVGQRLAELTGAEWGYVSCGCAAALAEVTAASMAGADPERMVRLPDTAGMPNEVLMQPAHRNAYDFAIRMTGARIVEVETLEQMEAAIGERTALCVMTGDLAHLGRIPVATMIEVAHRHGVPCLVDAAAERPDIPNVYLGIGADAVAYSGGKCLRGPQASGLVLGRKDLLWAAYLNAAPHHSLGRPMKAGKEEVMGLLAAVEAWVRGRDHQAEWRMWEGYLDTIRAGVSPVAGVRTAIEQPGVANVAPTLHVAWDSAALGCTPEQIHAELLEGQPRIAAHLRPDGLLIMPYMMEAGDEHVVARRLRELLTMPRPPQPAEPCECRPAAVAGDWVVRIKYTWGASSHCMSLQQTGEELRGAYRSQYAQGDLSGRVSGNTVAWRTTVSHQSNKIEYAFSGDFCSDGCLVGTVALGEFGMARWEAARGETGMP